MLKSMIQFFLSFILSLNSYAAALTLRPIDFALVEHQNAIKVYDYQIEANDILDIKIWKHPEFNINPSTYIVNHEGYIFFPLIGKIFVAHQTLDEIREKITNKLTVFFRNPQVNIHMNAYRSQRIYVLGAVVKPGVQTLTDIPLSLADAINNEGGINPEVADSSHIYVIRGQSDNPMVFWLNIKTPEGLLLAEKFALQKNDIVYVSTSGLSHWHSIISKLLP